MSRFATDVEANALRAIVHRTTKTRNVRAQAPRSDLQRSRPDRDTGPPRVRTTSPPAKKDSTQARAARLVRRPSPGTSVRRRHGPTCKGRDQLGILGRRAYGQRVLPQRRIHAARAARLVRRPSPGTSVRRRHGPTCKGRDQLGILGRRRVRTTNPPAKKDSRSKGSKARPAPGSARRPGRVVKGRGRPQTRKG